MTSFDEADCLRAALKEILSLAGYSVGTAQSGQLRVDRIETIAREALRGHPTLPVDERAGRLEAAGFVLLNAQTRGRLGSDLEPHVLAALAEIRAILYRQPKA